MERQIKNILIVSHYYPPHIGGIEIVAYNQAKYLAAQGNNVTVITSDIGAEQDVPSTENVRVVRIKTWNVFEKWGIPFPLFSPMLLFSLINHVRRSQVIHIHDAFYLSSFWAAVVARVYHKKIVLTQHVAMIPHPSRIVIGIQKVVYGTTGAMIFRSSDQILTFNYRVEQFLLSRGVDGKKISTLPNGVDTDLFHPVSAAEKKALRSTLKIPAHKKVVLFVGRFVPKKGLDKVLAVRSSEYHIVCAGGAIPAEQYDHVTFLGKLSQKALAKIYQSADVFLLPSKNEGFPLSIQEAMACGLPVITTFDPGYRRYGLDRNMISFLREVNEASIREAIAKIIHDDARLAAMSAYSADYAQMNFSWPRITNELAWIYDQILAKSSKKKIALVSDAVYPYNKGGKEKRIYEITTRLAAQGNEVTIYCMKWWKGEQEIMQDGVTLHAISPYYEIYSGNRRSIREAIFFAFNCFKLLGRDFDVIEVDHMPHLVIFPLKIVCLLKGKKMIATWHEVWGREYWKEYLGDGAKSGIAYAVEKLSARLPDLIISVSDRTTKNLRLMLGTEKRIITVSNGLDMVTILNNEPAPHGADVIFAGRLLSHKNVDVLLRAVSILLKKYPTLSLLIIGDGPEKSSLEAIAGNLGIKKNVSFLGFLEDQNELYQIMRASQIFVLPSTREGFGIAALEANACGMPVVTIDHEQNAAKDLVVNGENGILVNLDEYNIADAIEKLLNTKKNRAIYRTYAAKYDWNRIVLEIQKVYAL